MSTISVLLPSVVFESVRQSVDRLPADGDSFTLDAVDFYECLLCAESYDAAQFARRYRRYGLVTVTKHRFVTKPSR